MTLNMVPPPCNFFATEQPSMDKAARSNIRLIAAIGGAPIVKGPIGDVGAPIRRLSPSLKSSPRAVRYLYCWVASPARRQASSPESYAVARPVRQARQAASWLTTGCGRQARLATACQRGSVAHGSRQFESATPARWDADDLAGEAASPRVDEAPFEWRRRTLTTGKGVGT